MNLRVILLSSSIAFCVAGGTAEFHSLRKEGVSLRAQIAQSQMSLAAKTLALQDAAERLRRLDAQRTAASGRLNALERSLSPEKRRLMAFFEAYMSQHPPDRRPLILNTAGRPYFPELLNNPEYADAVRVVTQQIVETKYGRLLARLNLGTIAQDRLEDLLTQREMARIDADGLLGPDAGQTERMATKSNTVRDINEDIQTELGSQVSNALRAFSGKALYYEAMDDLETRLSYTTTPLQPEQAEHLVGLLSQALGRVGSIYWNVPDNVVAQSENVLSPPQVAALKQIQEEQRARIQSHVAKQSDI